VGASKFAGFRYGRSQWAGEKYGSALEVADWLVENVGRGPAAQAARKAIEDANYMILNNKLIKVS
jgi:hypothetical protein